LLRARLGAIVAEAGYSPDAAEAILVSFPAVIDVGSDMPPEIDDWSYLGAAVEGEMDLYDVLQFCCAKTLEKATAFSTERVTKPSWDLPRIVPCILCPCGCVKQFSRVPTENLQDDHVNANVLARRVRQRSSKRCETDTHAVQSSGASGASSSTAAGDAEGRLKLKRRMTCDISFPRQRKRRRRNAFHQSSQPAASPTTTEKGHSPNTA
jgi:hypothetical protein